MPLSRRAIVVSSATGLVVAGLAGFAWLRSTNKAVAPVTDAPAAPAPAAAVASTPAAATNPAETPRSIGSASAPITVTEFFSLTCTHCAAFMRDTFPTIKSMLIDTGKVHWVFVDYPLDKIALTAAMVARSLPADLYEPFVEALYQNQLHWAFNSDLDPIEGLAQEAALAGIPRSEFDMITANTDLQNWVLQERTEATNNYNIDATPTFRAAGPKAPQGQQQSGEMSYDEFTAFLATAG